MRHNMHCYTAAQPAVIGHVATTQLVHLCLIAAGYLAERGVCVASATVWVLTPVRHVAELVHHYMVP